MDGFSQAGGIGRTGCADPFDPACRGGRGVVDVFGYHDDREIPNYWSYARNFALQDRMFEPNASWSLPAHLFMVSEWSVGALQPCRTTRPAASTRSSLPNPAGSAPGSYAWTDLTFPAAPGGRKLEILRGRGSEPDCDDDAASRPPVPQRTTTPGIWNPLPLFSIRSEGWRVGEYPDDRQLRSGRQTQAGFRPWCGSYPTER